MTSYKPGDRVRITADDFEGVEAVYAKPHEPAPGIEASEDLHVLEVQRATRLSFFGDEFAPIDSGEVWS